MEIACFEQFLIIFTIEEYHENFRNIIYQICIKNKKEIKSFMWSDKEKEKEILEAIEKKTDEYIENIKHNSN